jgi:hypothetical protein
MVVVGVLDGEAAFAVGELHPPREVPVEWRVLGETIKPAGH